MTFMTIGSVEPYGLGARLRLRREQLGLTQQQVAQTAGLSRQLLVKIEHGHPRAELGKVMAVVKALGAELAIVDQGPRGSAVINLDQVLEGEL